MEKARKRNGKIVPFNQSKILLAISKAGNATKEFDESVAKVLTKKVLKSIEEIRRKIPTVEMIQDIVENVLLNSKYRETAKAYILYRQKRNEIREISKTEQVELVDQYIGNLDWQVKENSNMSYSLQGLNNYLSSELSKNYWLTKIYPQEIKRATLDGDFHIHDLNLLSTYCVGWDLQDLLVEGFKGVEGKLESKPAKHFRTALGQLVNFFYTMQGESAGAQAVSNFDTLLAPFIRFDELKREQIKQALQEFMFNMNVPTRVGFQCNDEQTEILTEDGWKKHNEVDLNKKIATYNLQNRNIEYLPIEHFFSKHYEGEMYHITSRKVDQLVSPEHRVVYRDSVGNDKKEIAENLIDRKILQIPIKTNGNISGNTENEDIIKLIAYIISEGSVDKNGRGVGRISIYQSKDKHPEVFRDIQKTLDSLGLKYTIIHQIGWGECDVFRLDSESSQFVYDIFDSEKQKGIKFVPKRILSLSKELSDLFIQTYLKGDGSLSSLRTSTVSEEIRDGLMSVAVNAGYAVSAKTIPVSKLGKNNKRDLIKIKFSLSDTSFTKIKKVNYSGIIWCPNTKNETVIARRNGKVFITGNTPFTNVTLDLKVPKNLSNQPVIIGGKPQKETYKEFQKEMDLFNDVFAEVVSEGDAKGRVFTFPIPTYNITKDFDWDNPRLKNLWKMTAKYGIPYFSNFINSDMDPEDSRSMCCRLRLDTKKLQKRGGGLFGANPLTGSIGVVTINLPRLGFKSRDKREFLYNLNYIMDLARDSLEIKRKILEQTTDAGLYPYSKFYLRNIKKRDGKYWGNHFSTIGLLGMNEALLNLTGKDISSKEGLKLSLEIMDFMRDKISKYQEETGNYYNLEATPAEGASHRLAKIDKEKYPEIIVANESDPVYYTNSTQLPVDFSDDVFEVLDLQDDLQSKYTGGTVIHLFMGEEISDLDAMKNLIKNICNNYKLPYFTISPTFSICPTHGYLPGKVEKCECGLECEIYARIVGYIRPIKQWNPGKRAEFDDRVTFKT